MNPLAREFAPGFRRRIVHASYSREAFWVDNAKLLAALGRGSRRMRARVLSLDPASVTTERGRIAANAVVVAAGAWTRQLLPRVRLELRRAALASIDARLPAMFHVLDSGLYARPDGDGQALVGDGDAPWRARPQARAALAPREFVRVTAQRMSQILGRSVSTRGIRAGLVAQTRSGKPVAERVRGVWVLAGFHGDGLVLAPGLAESMAEQILASA